MNGLAIEHVLDLIDANIDLSKREVLRYIADHEDEIVRQLQEHGEAKIPTTGGIVTIPVSALKDFAA